MKQQLNIVVALPSEARFFLDHFRLARLPDVRSYPLYANQDRTIYLIVSGIGKIRAAAAVSYLHVVGGNNAHVCYLNAGIAGSKNNIVGTLGLAHKISEVSSKKIFYPLPILSKKIMGYSILTVDSPSTPNEENVLVEMEAYGFHLAGLNLVTQEQIHTLKIVSDNALQSYKELTKDMVIGLFSDNASKITLITDFLLELSARENQHSISSPYFSDIVSKVHFTQYQQYELQDILRRWHVVNPNKHPLSLCNNNDNAKAILSILKLSINDHASYLL